MSNQIPSTGYLLINKPLQWTSFDVIKKLRDITGLKKIGHAGTLDPMAEGLLLCAVGKQATRNIQALVKLDKKYEATIRLDQTSETYDKEGEISEIPVKSIPSKKQVEKILRFFIGEIEQIPPAFSAKKIKGTPAYKLARKNKKIKFAPQKVMIYDIRLINYQWPELQIKVHCGSGTYIRSLAHDIGEKLKLSSDFDKQEQSAETLKQNVKKTNQDKGGLKTGGLLTRLVRTHVQSISLNQAIPIQNLTPENWREHLFFLDQLI